MYPLLTRLSSKVIVVCLLLSFALPTQAASLSDLSKSLSSLQEILNTFRTALLGSVSLTPLTAGVGTVITVSTDQQLLNALSSVTGGEIIKLQPGIYSAITIDPGFWKLRVGTLIKTDFAANLSSLSAPVTITSADLNNRAVLRTIQISNGAKNFRIENLSFRPQTTGTTVELNSTDITFTRNDISFGDSTNWTAADWNAKAGNAINASGANIDISYNYLKNVNFGINGGNSSHVHHNKIENFIGDGLRGWDNSSFDNNIVLNPYSVNDNHVDGFQSFAAPDESGSVKNVTLRNNSFIVEPSTNPLRGGMQGIGLFDGFYDNWIIENNLVLVDHGHGIAVMGGRTVSIQNNVALTPTTIAANIVTWIQVYPSKKGVPSTGVTYKNNYANTVMNTIDGNTKVPFSDYSKYFVNPAAGDFTFKQESVPFPVGAVIDMNLLAPEPYGVGTPVVTTPIPAPVVSLSTSLASVTAGNSVLLTWNSTNTTTCTASGSWSGTKSTSGSVVTGTLGTVGTYTFVLACTGTDGSLVSKSVSVTATAPVVAIIDTDADGVADSADNCPAVANGNQSDRDADGIGDVCDSTPDGVITPPAPTPVVTSVYPAGTTVVTNTDRLNVRSTPGAQVAGKQALGAFGTVLNQQPVLSKGYIWVYIDFSSGVDGWVADSYLVKAI